MLCKRGFLILFFSLGMLVAGSAVADDTDIEIKTPEKVETSLSRDGEATKHVSCQTECEKDGEDPYQCEEFCVLLVNWSCQPSATVAGR